MRQNIISFDPSNGEKLGDVPRATATQVAEVVGKAKEAAAHWRKVPLDERLRSIEKATQPQSHH
jgi:aldehyde dehydrogenase (NAD+)/succinate-semialdehyde dehydrogenase/glutarate-semialdehyde dehydrogenase